MCGSGGGGGYGPAEIHIYVFIYLNGNAYIKHMHQPNRVWASVTGYPVADRNISNLWPICVSIVNKMMGWRWRACVRACMCVRVCFAPLLRTAVTAIGHRESNGFKCAARYGMAYGFYHIISSAAINYNCLCGTSLAIDGIELIF